MTTTRLALALVLAACGEQAVERSGVDPATPVSELTSTDVQVFCDWAVEIEGGVGNSHACDDGTTRTTMSVARCVDTLADLTCPDPIGELEDCLIEIAGDLCLISTSPACVAFATCFPAG